MAGCIQNCLHKPLLRPGGRVPPVLEVEADMAQDEGHGAGGQLLLRWLRTAATTILLISRSLPAKVRLRSMRRLN